MHLRKTTPAERERFLIQRQKLDKELAEMQAEAKPSPFRLRGNSPWPRHHGTPRPPPGPPRHAADRRDRRILGHAHRCARNAFCKSFNPYALSPDASTAGLSLREHAAPPRGAVVDLGADHDARRLLGERAGFAGVAAGVAPARTIRPRRR